MYAQSSTPARAFNEHKKEIFLALSDHVAIALENFLQFGQPEMILAASKASKRFKEEMESIEALRKAGIVEPD